MPSESFFDNLSAVTSNIEEISFSKYAVVTEVNDDHTINCREKETDTLHSNVPCLNNSNNVGDVVLLGFVDNDVYNPIVIGNLNRTGGGGVSSYNDLTDQPQVNNVTLKGNKSLDELGVQQKLIAGSNISIVDNVISSNGGGSSVQSDWEETDTRSLAYILHKPQIPTNTSDLSNDSDFISDSDYVHTDNNFTNSLKAKLNSLENYDDTDVWGTLQELEENKQNNISDLNTIRNNSNKGATALQPNDNISKLTNDVGYLTHQSLTNYYTKDETYSSEEIDDYLDPLDIGMNDLYQNKQNKLISGSNIKTINNQSVLGSGDITIGGGGQVQSDYAQTDSTSVDFIKNKPNIEAIARQVVIDVLNEKFNGMISNAIVENGKLKISKFEIGDFNDE